MSEDAAPPLAKYLASTDKKTRDRAVKSLASFLSSREDQDVLPPAEMAKLWKGIFYCFWMSDKPLVQQALSSELAQLLLVIPATKASLSFLHGFWEAIVREWNGIDRLRMDKYYMLVRKFVNASFGLLRRESWNESVCDQYNVILSRRGGPLCPEDGRVPSSLTYHIADIYLEELDKVCNTTSEEAEDDEDGQSPPKPSIDCRVPLVTLVTPFLVLASRTGSSVTYSRLSSSLLEPLLQLLKPTGQREASDLPVSKKPRLLTTTDYPHLLKCVDKPAETRITIVKRIFDIASGPDTREGNRRRMYSVWKSVMAEEEEENDSVHVIDD